MIDVATTEQQNTGRLPNGAGAAALFSAGLGALTLAVVAILADHSAAFKKLMIFYRPTGPLSGVTTVAIGVWLLSWVILNASWKRTEVVGWRIKAGLVLIAISFVLMFPPVGDWF
jgi:hypothetical protein